jgi:hypothetical protein
MDREDNNAPPAGRVRYTTERPDSLKVEEGQDALVVTKRVRQPGAGILLFAAVGINYGAHFSGDFQLSRSPFSSPLLARFFLMVFGAFMAYLAAAVLIDVKKIRVTRELLRSGWVPLPRGRGARIPCYTIRQLYCTEQPRPNAATIYTLDALLRNSSVQELFTGTKEEVLYLEQEIERFLAIEDAPVVGEMAVPAYETLERPAERTRSARAQGPSTTNEDDA